MAEIVAAVVATIGLLASVLIIRGFAPYALGGRKMRDADGVVATTYRLSAGVALVICAYATRTIYWDVVPDILRWLGDGVWARWYDATGTAVNILFGAIFLRGIYHFAVLLWLLIPDEDRAGWSVLTAAWYPRHNAWTRAVGAWRDKLVSRRKGEDGN